MSRWWLSFPMFCPNKQHPSYIEEQSPLKSSKIFSWRFQHIPLLSQWSQNWPMMMWEPVVDEGDDAIRVDPWARHSSHTRGQTAERETPEHNQHGVGEEERSVWGWDSSGTHCRVVLQTILFKTSHQRIRGVVSLCGCVCVLSCVWLFAILKTVACQASLSLGFPSQEYWSGLPFPPPGDLPDPGIKPASPAVTDGFFAAVPPGKSRRWRHTQNMNFDQNVIVTEIEFGTKDMGLWKKKWLILFWLVWGLVIAD